MRISRNSPQPLARLATGIDGFDTLGHGGLPQYHTSLLLGGPGAGKTVFALQCLVNAARQRRTPGIFVAFEESARQIIANGNTFDWGLASLTQRKLFVMDAHLSPTLTPTYDIRMLLATSGRLCDGKESGRPGPAFVRTLRVKQHDKPQNGALLRGFKLVGDD